MALALALAATLVISGFPASGNDDTYITYWAAHAFARYGQVVNYNGAVLEQSSSLELVLLLGSIERVSGIAPIWSGWVVSMAGAALAIVLAALVARREGLVESLLAAFLTATALPLLYWSTSGMEMTLAAALGVAVIASVGACIDREAPLWIAALAMGAFALIRPESPVELVCALAFTVVTTFVQSKRTGDRTPLRRALIVLAVGASLVAVIATLRAVAFGSMVPNPARMKTGGFDLVGGARYLFRDMSEASPALLLAVPAGFVFSGLRALGGGPKRPGEATNALTLGFGAAGLAFVVSSGGDWMPAGRLLVPVIPALALLVAWALGALVKRQRSAAFAIAACIIALNLRGTLAFAADADNASRRGADRGQVPEGLSPDGPRYVFPELVNRAHRRDILILDPLLKAARAIRPTPQRPLVVVSGQAGMVPYYLAREYFGAFRFLDLYSLTGTDLFDCLPADHRRTSVHGVSVSLEELLKRGRKLPAGCGFQRPDIVFSSGTFPAFLQKYGYKPLYEGISDVHGYAAIDEMLAAKLGL